MKNKINELNNLYKPVLDNIDQLRQYLGSRCIDHALFFNNDHHIKIENEVRCVQYPIPTIICKLNGTRTKIGLDLATSEDYIGFVKFTLGKDEFLSFNFDSLKGFKFEVYGYCYCEELVKLEDLEQIKSNAIKSNDRILNIKIKMSSISQFMTIIDNLSNKSQKNFSMSSYSCDCGHQITVETYSGQCPICGKDSPSKRKFQQQCPVCDKTSFVDQYGNGDCDNCGWSISTLDERYEDEVIYPNLVSLNKARILIKEGKPFRPDLNDFIEALYFYSEMEFWYEGLNCCLFLRSNTNRKIEFGWSPENVYYFLDKEDFIQNAKIGDEYVRDIWDKVENPKYI